jgi:hypothetical protein
MSTAAVGARQRRDCGIGDERVAGRVAASALLRVQHGYLGSDDNRWRDHGLEAFGTTASGSAWRRRPG